MLRNNELRPDQILQAIADTLPYGILLLDSNLRIVFSNNVAQSLLGMKEGPLIGESASEIIPCGFEDFESHKTVTPSIIRLKDNLIEVSCWPASIKTGETFDRLYTVVSLVDVGEIMDLRHEVSLLRESCRDLSQIFELSFHEIYVTDGDGNTLMVNSASERLYGVPASYLYGRNVKDLEKEGFFYPSITPVVLDSGERVSALQHTKSGRQVFSTAVPVFDADGKIIRVISNAREIVESKHLRTILNETLTSPVRPPSKAQMIKKTGFCHNADGIVARNPAMKRVIRTAAKVAPFDSTVLLTGESGTGKDTIAKLIHRCSPRSSGPFIKVNCGSIPESLLESELFGYVPGAFTGASRRGKVGLIELANHGTLFLNEIDSLPLHLQVKLLHVIEDKCISRVGDTRTIKLDIRVIAASIKDLKELTAQGRFREDLFYRLNVVSIHIPPLRERREDIAPLVTHLLEKICAKHKRQKSVSEQVMEVLSNYSWPGNVRQLENALEHAVVVSDGAIITLEDLPIDIRTSVHEESSTSVDSPSRLVRAIEALEKELLTKAVDMYGSTRKAARFLGISQSSVVRKMKKYNIVPGAMQESGPLHARHPGKDKDSSQINVRR